MSALTLVGGRVVDPVSGRDTIANVVVRDGMVTAVGQDVEGERVDVSGCLLTPGLVDVHVHLRQPGFETSETIESGTAAAAAGGYTAVCSMANTDPVTDTLEVIEFVRSLAASEGHCDVVPSAAITHGLAGERIVDIEGLAAAGVRCFSDDGMPVMSPAVMREALRRTSRVGCIVANHAEDRHLTSIAQANEGRVAEALDLPGWPSEAEEIMVARDLLLAVGLDARLHVPHVSTARTVELVRVAKRRGVRVTAEATPHHFVLTDELVRTRDPVFKVNPPLRSLDDVAAVRRGLADGTIDLIATDHAPHGPQLKARPWTEAPCGMLGLETAFALTLGQLVEEGHLTLPRAVAALSLRPARTFLVEGHGGPIAPGAPANLAVFDPGATWTVDAEALHSRSHNTPFAGFPLRGRAVHTLLRGRFTLRDGRVTEPVGSRAMSAPARR